MILAYHFVGKTLRDGSPIPPDGAWLEVAPPIELCRRGLHWSRDPLDALTYAPGNTLCLVEAHGEILEQGDKGCSTRRRIVARIDAEPLLFGFARWAALQVIHLWEAPQIVRDFLETGDETLRSAAWAAARDAAWDAARAARDAARDAAWAAAWAAARDAARAAAWDAAWDAARAARDAAWAAARDAARAAAGQQQRVEFRRRVDAAFAELTLSTES